MEQQTLAAVVVVLVLITARHVLVVMVAQV
jgi:hypothetical protein